MRLAYPHSLSARPAFTLVELLLAVALSAFIGSAIVVMLGAATSATSLQADSRRSTMARQVAAERLGTLVRTARTPLYASSSRLLLWTVDRNGDGVPQISEMRLVSWAEGPKQVLVAEASAGAPPTPDSTIPLDGDFAAAADMVASTSPSRVVLQHVSRFEVSLDDVHAPTARRVRFQAALESDHGTDNSTIIASPRGAQ